MKSARTYPEWKGFEIRPEGALLEQKIDLSGAMGYAYERSCDFYKSYHTHERLMFVFPRGNCRMRIRSKNPKASYTIDASTVLIVPISTVHDDEGLSAVYDTIALYPSKTLIASTLGRLKISDQYLIKFTHILRKIRRSSWLEQLVEEYFFRKVIGQIEERSSLDFLESEVTAEVARIALGIESRKNLSAQTQRQSEELPSERAIRYIETRLFEKIDLSVLSKQAGASVSTLIRSFKKDLKLTPYEYIRNRRLDEAMGLLNTGRYPVGQVAILVGYLNFGAFTDAFKQRFKKLPSDISTD